MKSQVLVKIKHDKGGLASLSLKMSPLFHTLSMAQLELLELELRMKRASHVPRLRLLLKTEWMSWGKKSEEEAMKVR